MTEGEITSKASEVGNPSAHSGDPKNSNVAAALTMRMWLKQEAGARSQSDPRSRHRLGQEPTDNGKQSVSFCVFTKKRSDLPARTPYLPAEAIPGKS